jgi:hypothetical protein
LDLFDTYDWKLGRELFPETAKAKQQLKNIKTTTIKITPEMKAKILEEGLPTFKRGGEVRSSLYDIDIFGAEMR